MLKKIFTWHTTSSKAWLPAFKSALVLYDGHAGYRRFLGADPKSARELADACIKQVVLDDGSRVPAPLLTFGSMLQEAVLGQEPTSNLDSEDLHFAVHSDRLHHQMVERAAGQVEYLVQEGVPANEIAIISPFLSDSLHYAFATRLDAAGIGHFVHRPSRTLRDEPITRVLMTLATLAHPEWQLQRPALEAISHAFYRLIGEADLIRATLLASSTYEITHRGVGLTPFEELSAELQERISYRVGEKYEGIRIVAGALSRGA